MTPNRLSLRHVLVVIVALTAAMSPAVHADGLQDAGKLLKQGQTKQALEQVDAYLADHPKDASGRFLRGVILHEMNRNSDAIAIFTKLTEDYPDLPQPYNNLAVIYAEQKQYDKAKSALEAAIRTDPSYATAHENLGDIYARMASQAYAKALQLDSSEKTAQTKLSMIRDLMTVSARTAEVPAVVATATAKAPAAAPKSVAAPAAAKPAAKPAEPAKPEAIIPAADDVAKVLAGWAAAWSHKDAAAYLAFYAGDFKTPGGETRAAWAAERTRRITKPGVISVSIEDARVTPVTADRVTVKFRQHYKSASLSGSTNKVLEMERKDGSWKITQERIGN